MNLHIEPHLSVSYFSILWEFYIKATPEERLYTTLLNMKILFKKVTAKTASPALSIGLCPVLWHCFIMVYFLDWVIHHINHKYGMGRQSCSKNLSNKRPCALNHLARILREHLVKELYGIKRQQYSAPYDRPCHVTFNRQNCSTVILVLCVIPRLEVMFSVVHNLATS